MTAPENSRIAELEAALDVAVTLLEQTPELARVLADVADQTARLYGRPDMTARAATIRAALPVLEKFIVEARLLVPRA